MAPLSQASALAIARLRAYRPPPGVYTSLPLSRRAAVLILLFPDRDGDLSVVLTLRASNMSSYAGQVSLPGGKADFLSETPFQTARREAEEEIGLPRDDKLLPPPFRIEHLCELPTHLALTELGVRPCVAFLHTGGNEEGQGGAGAGADAEESLIPRLNAKEVQEVFTAPFEKFLSGEKKWYRGSWGMWNDSNWRMNNFYIPKRRQRLLAGKEENKAADDTHRVFGLTAAILIGAARTAYGRDPDFPHHEHIGEEAMIRQMLEAGRLGPIRKPGSKITPEDLAMAKAREGGMEKKKEPPHKI